MLFLMGQKVVDVPWTRRDAQGMARHKKGCHCATLMLRWATLVPTIFHHFAKDQNLLVPPDMLFIACHSCSLFVCLFFAAASLPTLQ